MSRTKSYRRLRRLLLSRKLWKMRLVFWCGALGIGLAASLFAGIADWAQGVFTSISTTVWLSPLLISPAVFALTAWLTARLCPMAVGSGIPQAIAAQNTSDLPTQKYLLGVRVIVWKMLLTTLALLGGASVGREGPTVQVGAAIMLLCSALGGMSRQRGIVSAGAAAGVAAAFNTPLAGVVFAIEEMTRSFRYQNSAIVLIAIVFSGIASMSISGNYTYFGYADADFDVIRDIIPVIVIGIAGGVAGSLFSWTMTDGVYHVKKLCAKTRFIHPVWFAGTCGLMIAVIGLLTHGQTFGTGYAMAGNLLHDNAVPSWWFFIGKFLSTLVSNVSGIPGGLFSPSLTIGASMGSSMTGWFDAISPQGVVLLGMVAYLAGVTQAPITAFVIVLEITGKGVMPVPLIATAVLAASTGRILTPVSLYHRLAHDFAHKAQLALGDKPAAPPEPEHQAPMKDNPVQ